jgi:UDP-2,3-diacylglucosamine pyrophosphatase LpxH
MLKLFLDYVEDHNGQLVILGDLFELLRYPLDSVIAKRRDLLDRLARIEALYVPGNHDEGVASLIDVAEPPHPFFARMSSAFSQSIGEKRFRFMHGHEVDPLASPRIQNIGRMIGSMACLLEYYHGTCVLSNDTLTDALLEVGEQMLRLRTWLTCGMNKAVQECCGMVAPEKMTYLKRRIRTERMLQRYYTDKEEGLYDIAIVGHTHRAGTFSDWYFNSGSWTGPTNDFLEITPDGEVGIFDWSWQGPRRNNTLVVV